MRFPTQPLQVADLWSLVWLSNIYTMIYRLDIENGATIWNLIELSQGPLMFVKSKEMALPPNSFWDVLQTFCGYIAPPEIVELVEV